MIHKLSDIIPDIEAGMTYKEIAKKYKRAESTVWLWVRKLRQGGFEIKNKPGRKPMPL